MPACSLVFFCFFFRNGKLSNKNTSCKCAPFQKWSRHVDEKTISSSPVPVFSPYPAFTLNPSAILSFMPSSALHPHFTFVETFSAMFHPIILHRLSLSVHNFPDSKPCPPPSQPIMSLVYSPMHLSIPPSIDPSASKAKQLRNVSAAIVAPGPLLSVLPPGMLRSQWGYWRISHCASSRLK